MNISEVEFKEGEKWWHDIWFGWFLGTAVIGTIGNILIIWIIVAHKSMRTQLNIFIVNMAVSDLIAASCSIPLEGYQLIYHTWIFGSIACTIQQSAQTIGLCVFILSVTMIAMERHYAIIPPVKRNILDTNTMTSLEIWITSAILSAPNWIFATVYIPPDTNNPPKCIQVWPDADTGNSLQEMYSVFFIFLTYVLPLVYMIYRFVRLSVNLWVTRSWPTSCENKQSVKMMFVIVLIYGITSLPLRFCNLFEDKCSAMIITKNDRITFITVVFWLALSDATLNPIILCCMDKKFRLGFKKAISWFPLVYYNQENILEKGTGQEN